MILLRIACRRFVAHIAAGVLVLVALCGLVACGATEASSGEPQVETLAIRSPHPTFTATPRSNTPAVASIPTAAVTSAPVENGAAGSQTSTPAPPAADEKVKLVINADMVYLRQGPGTDADYITLLQQGQEFDIVGKNAGGDWWFVCCWEEKAGWVNSEFCDVSGPADQVPVVADDASAPTSAAQTADQPDLATATVALAIAPPTATPPPEPANPPATDTETPVPQGGEVNSSSAFAFDLVAQEQFPETNVVRVFLYVFDDKNALDGYSLQVKKDGADLPVKGTSFGPNVAYTWPVAEPRQHAQNFKVEFPNQNPAGLWEVQLTLDGAPVGPVATFTLIDGDQNRELYVRYKKR